MIKIFIMILSLSPILHASSAPENILTKNCLESYLKTYKTQKDHKAFVYARESETGKDRCGWGYGYESVKAANKGAMKQCTGFQLNAECIIIDTDGEYLVKEGDFSPITQPDDTPLTSEEEDKLLNDAKPIIQGNCLPFFKDYLKDKGHKAFAYSLDADGTYACGKIYNTSTMVAAHKGALKGCDNNKQKRGKKKPKSPCKVYAKGNKILLEAKDFALVRIEKELSDEAYNIALQKAKTMVKKGPCLFQMKYYLRGSEHQAYFLAQDKEGKQVCGRSEGEKTLDIALSKALKACDEKLRDMNLVSKCMLIAKEFDIVGEVNLFATKEKVLPKKDEEVDSQKIQKLFNVLKKKDKNKKVDMNKPLPLKETLKMTADTLNKDLPTMVDEELRLDKVTSDDYKMTFHYTLVHFTPISMPAKKLKSLMYKDIKAQVCTEKDTKILLKQGMLVDYTYNGKDKTHITTFAFDAKACGLLTNVEQIKKNILNLIKKK